MEIITYGGKYLVRADKNVIEANGFTKFTDSIIAKVGILDYNDASEPNGIRIENRGHDELFSQSHLDSLNGSPLTYIHPEEMVNGVNYKEHIVGTVINPRRVDDNLVADIIVYDDEVIGLIEAGTVELSEGYSLNELVKNDELGHYEQVGMVANHLAIVPKGRCGGSCKLNFDAKTGVIKSDTILTSKNKERVNMGLFKKDTVKKIYNFDGIDYDLTVSAEPLVELIETLKARNDSLMDEASKSLKTLSDAGIDLQKKDEQITELKAKASDEAINVRVDALVKRNGFESYLVSQGVTNLDSLSDDEVERTYNNVKLVAGRNIASGLNADASGGLNTDSKREQFMKAQKDKR